jgi:fermentation-respiration switch protein FrsA (DUF1100 family)
MRSPSPLVLVGHGAGIHAGKDEPRYQEICRQLTSALDAAVLIIDGPTQGERTPRGADAQEVARNAQLIQADPDTPAMMARDWAAAVEVAQQFVNVGDYALGYIGFSMGVRLGLPTVAAIHAIRAAVFGVGGVPAPGGTAAVLKAYGTPAAQADEIERLTPVESRSADIRAAAARLTDQEILMVNAVDDMLHPVDYAMQLYRAFATPTKRIAFFPGNHSDLRAEALLFAAWWLKRRLDGVAGDDAPTLSF